MNICKICFNEINETTVHNLIKKDVTICHDCLMKFGPVLRRFKVEDIECFHLYYYNPKVQEILYQFKGCKDIELSTVFLEYYKDYLNYKFKGYIMIPAPSVEEEDKNRGFNHVEKMYENLKLEMIKCVHKNNKQKQAKSNAKERKKINKLLTIDNVDLEGKKVLIVDDVFTTGSTVRSMIELVKKFNPKIIKVLVMSKTLDFDQR